MEYCKMWAGKTSKSCVDKIWTRYRMPNCHPEGNEPLGQKSIWASKLRQNDFLSPHTICSSSRKVACSLGTAAHRLQDAVWCQAQVVYCKPLEKPRFAVGLELFTRVERWAKPPRR